MAGIRHGRSHVTLWYQNTPSGLRHQPSRPLAQPWLGPGAGSAQRDAAARSIPSATRVTPRMRVVEQSFALLHWYAARRRLARRVSVRSGTIKGNESTHSPPLSIYSAPGDLRQDPGRAVESPAETRTCGNGSREVRVVVGVWVARGRRTGGGTRGAVAGTRRGGCGCARRRMVASDLRSELMT